MLQGILNGCGKQGLNAKLSLVSSYCVGVPAAVVLCFALELGVLGLWLGLGLGQFFRCCVGHWLVSAQLSLAAFSPMSHKRLVVLSGVEEAGLGGAVSGRASENIGA